MTEPKNPADVPSVPHQPRPADSPRRPDVPGQQRAVPPPGLGRTRPLDPAGDPDRYRPDGDPTGPDRTGPPPLSTDPLTGRTRALDPAGDPDRYEPLSDGMPTPQRRRTDMGAGRDLEQLLGSDATHEGERDGLEWLIGLLAVLAFLGLVAFLFTSVLTP